MTSCPLPIRWGLFDCGWKYLETRGGLATPSAQPAPYYAACQLNQVWNLSNNVQRSELFALKRTGPLGPLLLPLQHFSTQPIIQSNCLNNNTLSVPTQNHTSCKHACPRSPTASSPADGAPNYWCYRATRKPVPSATRPQSGYELTCCSASF
jgi:hypothetical protein